MFDLPAKISRSERQYVASAVAVTMEEFGLVEGLTDEVYEWLEREGVSASGSPFTRLPTRDMTAKLDIEVGAPVDGPVTGDDRIIVDSLPSGTYVTLTYSAAGQSDLRANEILQAWAANQGLEWQMNRSSGVEIWSGRFEFYHADKSRDDDQIFEVSSQITDG